VAGRPFIGEGFDCPMLDALFLAAPIAFKGRLVQYVRRILRPHPGKTTVEVYDYRDIETGVLASSLAKHAPGYTSLGFPNRRITASRSRFRPDESRCCRSPSTRPNNALTPTSTTAQRICLRHKLICHRWCCCDGDFGRWPFPGAIEVRPYSPRASGTTDCAEICPRPQTGCRVSDVPLAAEQPR
jgi:hypothetical protein